MKMNHIKHVSLTVAGAAVWLAALVQPAHANLIGWYTFNDPANLGLDSSGNGNNGTNVSFSAPVGYSSSGVFGAGSAVFDGLGGGFLTLPINASVTSLPDMTWGAWVNPSALDGVRDILDIDQGGFGRTINLDYRAGGDYNAFTGTYGPGLADSGVIPAAGQWTFIAAVYQNDYYGSLGSLDLYVNGTLAGSFETDFTVPSWNFITVGGSSSFDEFWGGQISDVFVDGTALNPSQISDVYTSGPGVLETPEPATLALAGLGGAALLAARRKK